MRSVLTVLATVALLGCDGAQTNAELSERVQELEAKISSMESGGGAAPAAQDETRDREAYEKYQELQAALQKGDYDAVRKHIADMERDYSDVAPAMQAIASVKDELALIGSDAPEFTAQKWFTGQPTTFADSDVTLVVFWEVWCPHCQREVPRLEASYAKLKGKGLNVVGLTQVSNDKTDEEVAAFLKENEVTYPNAKVDDGPATAFQVGGIPAAAIIKDGKIVWRGHPGNLSDDTLEGYLEG